MADTRQCANDGCEEWIEWQDTADPYTLQAHFRLWAIPTDLDGERPGGYFCSPECAIEFIESMNDFGDWGEQETVDLDK